MRRTKNISIKPKSIAATILAAALMMTSTAATVLLNPTAAYAETVPDNGQNVNLSEVSEGDSMNNNRGAIDENKGIINNNYGSVNDNKAAQSEGGHDGCVNNNYGTITTNNGQVGNNREYNGLEGKIETNNGTVVGNGTGLTNGEDDGNGIRINNGDVWTNFGYIHDSQGAVHTNKGLINKNEGNDPTTTIYNSYIAKGVHDNEGTITLNTGLVEINKGTGVVTNNRGTVTTSYGTVTNNSGKITTNDVTTINNNHYTGKVDNNNGEIATNNGLVENNHGVIKNNFGDVGCCGEYQDGSGYHPITSYIVNQYDGVLTAVAAQGSVRNDTEITNYFGGTISGNGFAVENNFSDQNITATNQYRSVSFVADEVSTEFSINYGTGFTEKTLREPDGTDGDTRHYINVTNGNGSGTITITADDGYEVKQSGQASVTGFDYTLTKQGNDCVLNITGYNGNSIELSPGMFGLVVEEIQQTDPDVPGEETITVSDNKPMAVSVESKGEFKITYAHEIPFFGKGKLTPESFGGLTVSQGNATYKVTKIKVNKKKHRIQITGLQGADKATVKKVKKETKGSKGLPFKSNPYYVRDTDKVTPKFKKSGDLKSVKVFIDGKDYKVKKDEYSYDSSKKQILFKGNNLNGSYSTK